MGSNVLRMFMPAGIEPLFIIGAAFALILGLTSIRGAGRFLVCFLVVPALLSPFLASLVRQLPPLVLLGLFLVLGVVLLKAVVMLILGRHAAAEMTGILAADLVKWALFAPFRLFRRLVGRR